MAKRIRITALVLLVALIAAQAFRIDRTNPPPAGALQTAPDVASVLRRACYDCHSNETVWPWYSNVAPISWLLSHDVKEGRGELNFSVWDTYTPKKRAKKLKETAEVVVNGEMPPWYYVLMHRDAALGDAEREALRKWVAEQMAQLAQGAQ